MLRAIYNTDVDQVKHLLAETGKEKLNYFLLLQDAVRLLDLKEKQDVFLSSRLACAFFSMSRRPEKLEEIDNLVDIIYLLLERCNAQSTALISFINQHHLFDVLASVTATKVDFTQKKPLLLALLAQEKIQLSKENGGIRLLTYALTQQDAELIATVLTVTTDDTLTEEIDYFGKKTFVALFEEPWTKKISVVVKYATATHLAKIGRNDLIQQSGLANNTAIFNPDTPSNTLSI